MLGSGIHAAIGEDRDALIVEVADVFGPGEGVFGIMAARVQGGLSVAGEGRLTPREGYDEKTFGFGASFGGFGSGDGI